MQYTIEKIPLPKGRNSGGISDAMRQLCVGESFEIPNPKQKGLHSLARQLGIKVATRRTENGVRVWRVENEPINQLDISEDVAEVPMMREEKLENLRAMMADPKPFLAPEPVQDEWEFVKVMWDGDKGEYYAVERNRLTRKERPSTDAKYADKFPD